jgi:hypothetical protein
MATTLEDRPETKRQLLCRILAIVTNTSMDQIVQSPSTERQLLQQILSGLGGGGGGVSGGGNVFGYGGDPNGHVTATGAAICLGSGAAVGQVWQKTTSGTSNSEWVQIIA